MVKLVEARAGEQLAVKDHPLAFSFYPMRKSGRRYGLNNTLYTSNPWSIMRSRVRGLTKSDLKNNALSFLDQSEEFYSAALQSTVMATKPLLLYYSLLSLSKSYITFKGTCPTFEKSQHGLHAADWSEPDINNVTLTAFSTPNARDQKQVFAEFYSAICGGRPLQTTFLLNSILPQILPGHRLWTSASAEKERFIYLHRIDFIDDRAQKMLWLRCYCFHDDLVQAGYGAKDIISFSLTKVHFRHVKCSETYNGRRLVCFEQMNSIPYTDRPSDVIPQLVNSAKLELWRTVLTIPPYRSYYLYVSPQNEIDQRIPQLLSIYLVMFYLGMITRYRPDILAKLLKDEYGGWIEEFVNAQPLQFIYMLASDFAEQEVTRAGII